MAFGDFFLVSICCLYTARTWRCSAWVSHQQKHTSTRARFDTVHSPLSSIKRWTYASTKQHQDLTSIPLSRYCPNQELLDFSGNRWMQNAIDVVRLNANIYFYWILFRQLFLSKEDKILPKHLFFEQKMPTRKKEKSFWESFPLKAFFLFKSLTTSWQIIFNPPPSRTEFELSRMAS